MVNPVIVGAAISAAGSLLGGRHANKSNESIRGDELAAQKEFAQHGIRWKVEDAKAAGLHPLYALGAQTTPYQPVAIQDSMGPAIAEAGQHIGRAVAATSTPAEKQLAALAIAEGLSRIRMNDATAGYYHSEAARNAQAQTPGIPDVGISMAQASREARASFAGPFGGRTTPPVDATVITSAESDPALALGPTPVWRQFTIGRNTVGQSVPMVLPGGMQGDAAEVLESVMESYPLMSAVYRENVKRFGQSWGDWFLNRYMPFGEVKTQPRKFRNVRTKPKVDFVPYEGY